MIVTGLDGSNPLAFLAALGTLRLSERLFGKGSVSMRWELDGCWRPRLSGLPTPSPEEFCAMLADADIWFPEAKFTGLGANLTVAPDVFRDVYDAAARDFREGDADDRVPGFAAAFGSDVCEAKEKGRIEYSDLSFITGSGHQDFLGTARNLAVLAGADRLREALFGPWKQQDESNSFRWDPDDAKEYALRWTNPSKAGVTTVWGANRLAFEALPLLPTIAVEGGRLRTTGFRRAPRVHEFTWPLWKADASCDTVRSLLSLRILHQKEVPAKEVEAMGIARVFRCQRVRIGQGANFKVSFRPAFAV